MNQDMSKNHGDRFLIPREFGYSIIIKGSENVIIFSDPLISRRDNDRQ